MFRRPIRANPENEERIIKAYVCLHKYFVQTENAGYAPTGFVNSQDGTGDFVPGSWRPQVANDHDKRSALRPLTRAGSNTYNHNSKRMRNNLKAYFNSPAGSVSW